MKVGKYLALLNPAKEGGSGIVEKAIPRIVEKAERSGLAYVAGLVQNKFRHKASLFGAPADLVAGAVGTGTSLAMSIFGKGQGRGAFMRTVHSQADIVGDVGLMAFFHTIGAGKGAKTSGVVRLLVPAADVAKVKKILPSAEVVGAIDPAPAGDRMTQSDLASLRP